MKESITFIGVRLHRRLRPQRFISNTSPPGRHRHDPQHLGHQCKTITQKITSAEDERVNNGVTSSTILAFNQDELMKSDRGGTSTFPRVTL
jgi:hypothetical protein